MEVFCLSGLGADRTVFNLLDLSWCTPVFIDWIAPEKKESLEHYALRLKDSYIPGDACVIGLSFGGMLLTEMAKQYPQIKGILVSSAKTRFEIPAVYKYGKYFPLHQWSSQDLQRWFMLRMQWLLGITTAEAIEIYKGVIRKSNTSFNQWAVNSIIDWGNTKIPANVVHIHGTNDKVLPYKYIKCDYAIKGGGHFMIMENADVLSALLHNIAANNFMNPSLLSSSANRFEDLHQE